jgi:hypothetical protein
MNDAVPDMNRQMKLPRPAATQQHVPRPRRRLPHQPFCLDQRRNPPGIAAAQRIAVGHLPDEPARAERPGRQPDAIQPRRRIAPVQPEPRAHCRPRCRDDTRAHIPG